MTENTVFGDRPSPLREERRREVRLRRSNLLASPYERSISYKIATERAELEAAFQLVWRSYVEVGLQADDGVGIRFTKHHLLPSTKVLIAVHRPELAKESPNYLKVRDPGEIVGTLTIILDSPMGLPMEEVCAVGVQELRDEGRRPAEVVALAVRPEFRKYNVMMYLYKLMFQYIHMKGVTDVTCSVTKRHISFYRSMLLFEPMGELRAYSSANGLEVQCHRLDVLEAEKHAQDVYHCRDFDADLYVFFFTDNKSVGRPLGEGTPWSADRIEYFLSRRPDLRAQLDDPTKRMLRDEYEKANAVFPL